MRLRTYLATATLGLMLGLAAPASAQLLPTDFFQSLPVAGQGQAVIEADRVSFEGATGTIIASGNVTLLYQGYTARADRLRLNQRNGEVLLEGNVSLLDPTGSSVTADRIELTGEFRQAVLRSISVTASNGARVTAAEASFSETLETRLLEASYSPCGDCIDEQGRRIGWSVRAGSITVDDETRTIYLEDPVLELLGIPVAWLPWLALPDPTRRESGFGLPAIDYSDDMGVKLTLPYTLIVNDSAEIIFTPTLLSRQGGLLGAEWRQRFDFGDFYVRGGGLYQLDRSAFAGEVGDRDWRGYIQTAGTFQPVESWTAGWSYTAFTDPAFFGDYRIDARGGSTNELYVQHLSRDAYLRVALQEFVLLGNVSPAEQDEQAVAIPNARYDQIVELAPGMGRIEFSSTLLVAQRDADDVETVNATKYVFGFEGIKAHLMAEAGWQNQIVAPGGILVTPYLGVRLDAANYDGASTDPSAPAAQYLLFATPIAALDVRWPLIATDGDVSHLLEPIAQLVWRGSDTTSVGITNDDAQSFVFEDNNLFSYNRFSGSDRQETGLRLNIGGHYLMTLGDDVWLDFIGGQSFHLAGVNALAIGDAAQTGTSSGLDSTASYLVGGVQAGFGDTLTFGGKVQIDPMAPRVTRAGLGGDYRDNGWEAGLNYVYIAGSTSPGVPDDQHEIAGRIGIPVDDYWTIRARLAWDLAARQFLEAGGGVTYDDDYLRFGFDVGRTGPTHQSPNDTRFTASFALSGPDGTLFGF